MHSAKMELKADSLSQSAHACRKIQSNAAEWRDLPSDLLDLIMRKAFGSKHVKEVLSMRLVCKAWRDACSQYAGAAHCRLRQSSQLSQANKTLPALSGLSIEICGPDVDFAHLSGFHQLSSLSLLPENKPFRQYPVDLDVLPSSLKCLSITSFWLVLTSSTPAQLAGLTSVTLTWKTSKNTAPEILYLLKQLPQLKVSFVHLAGRLFLGS